MLINKLTGKIQTQKINGETIEASFGRVDALALLTSIEGRLEYRTMREIRAGDESVVSLLDSTTFVRSCKFEMQSDLMRESTAKGGRS
jgi:hypothetical protein